MPTKQARKTKRRKDRQREQRRIMALRERAMGFAGVSPVGAARMSPEALERVVRLGTRRRMVSPVDDLALALALSAMYGPRQAHG